MRRRDFVKAIVGTAACATIGQPALAAELVSRNATVIFTATTVSAVAAKAATSTIPVVFAIGSDPVKSGLVTSLNRPGGNLTGVSFFTNQMEAKRLALLHEIAPNVNLVAVLLNPNNPPRRRT
jgi:putative ABC transport system substrate-binding protein